MAGEFIISGKASAGAVARFFAKTREQESCIQGLVIWKDGSCIVKAAPAPYSIYDRGEVFSLSKSFCSTAVGLAIAEGKLSLDEKMADIFPEAARGADEKLAQATVQDLLTMRTGHKACVMPALARSFDPPASFFAQKAETQPGTHFAYNTAATYMLSCAVQKRTGMTITDYLEPRLFEPLGIRGIRWNSCNGVNEGGIGLHVSVEDIWRLGVLYLQKGVWEGRRILSEEWVADATSAHADNSMNGTPDWCAGYGYQFWRNSQGGFRGDGAYGQLCLVFPEQNTVVAIRALVVDMQQEIDDVREMLRELESDASETASVPAYPTLAEVPIPEEYEGLYRCHNNPFGWTQLRITHEGSTLLLRVQDGEKAQELRFGAGKWEESTLTAKCYCPKLVGLQDNRYTEEMRFAGCYGAEGDDALTLVCRYHTSPLIEQIHITSDGGVLSLNWTPWEGRAHDAAVLTAYRL